MNIKIKILCTLGPSSMKPDTIIKLDRIGVDIFRINLSHTDEKNVEKTILQIKKFTQKPICLDTEGAQIRNGQMSGDSVHFAEGAVVKLHRDKIIGDACNLWLNPPSVLDMLEQGDLIAIDFDTLLLKVTGRSGDIVETAVICAGTIGNNKAVTVDKKIDLPPLSEKDLMAIKIGRKHDIRHIALSFAGSGSDVEFLRTLTGPKTTIISKIESRLGLSNLDSILSASDAILIDRGDLSREESLETIPFLQKEIIKRANKKHCPVYVATNLLESMVHRKVPTRSEVNDIMNTLLDGADGLVLAAETAIGNYPLECVTMVKRIIRAYGLGSGTHSAKSISSSHNISLMLNEPHGGFLVNAAACDFNHRKLGSMTKLMVDETAILDAEQIAIGAYSPINGFMTRDEIGSVLDDYRMPGGPIWTLPIVLQVPKDRIKQIRKGDDVALVSRSDGIVHATLSVTDIYNFDFRNTAIRWFGTADHGHPGVRMLMDGGEYFIGGPVRLIKRLETGFEEYTLTPLQTRHIFEKKGWNTVAGFHTRNVIHRVHEHLQLSVLDKFNIDGLFIHPVIGPKKKSDFKPDVILKSYSLMLGKHYPKNRVLLGAFLTFSRYAGPREAIFTALCRKNFGCTHFIVGRDHTGAGDFYRPHTARRLFEKLGDIGIAPIFFNETHYCGRCRAYVEKCSHGRADILRISGTEAREMLRDGRSPPGWFMRRDISKMVLDEVRYGNEVFVG